MPSVSDEDSNTQMTRVASVTLPSLASRSGNIDISRQGSIALLTEETIYIFTSAIGVSALLKPNLSLICHHDSSQKVPFFRSLIGLKSCPPDNSKTGSGLDAYMLAYQPRFMDAKWSTSDVGPFSSPILAVLTTQSQIFLYTADTNQFKGPWRQLECLTGGTERHIVSIAWVEGSSTQSWLLAGTRQGEIVVWSVGADSVKEHSITSLIEAEITGMTCSPSDLIFLSTSKGIHIAQVIQAPGSITFQSAPLQPPSLSGSHVSLAKWHGTAVLYCTPVQVHHFDVKTGKSLNVMLISSEDEESCCFRPAVAITPVEVGSWEVYLNDGTLYHISHDTLARDFLGPVSYLAPPNEVIGSLQRQVEAARGLFAKFDDGAGMTYLCHDGNEIASWSYYREPKCQFGIGLTREPRSTQEMPMAIQLLDGALKGDHRHLRTLITFYRYTAISKGKIWTMLQQALQREIESKQNIQAALRLAVWMQSEDAKDTSVTAMHKDVFELSLAEALRHRVDSKLEHISSFMDEDDVNHCTRLARAGHALSIRVKNKALQESCQRLMKAITISFSNSDADSFDLGERCKACGSSVTFQINNMLYAKCQKGHIWKRCATSLALLTSSLNRTCSICSSETIQPMHATSKLQRRLIESTTSCDLCHGTFFL